MAQGIYEQFAMMAADTPLSFASDENGFINDVWRRTNIISPLLAGKMTEDLVESGVRVVDDIFLDGDPSSFRFYKPGTKQTFSRPRTSTRWGADFCAAMCDVSWVEDELDFNVENPTEEQVQKRFKSVWNKLKTKLANDAMTGLDDMMIAPPDYTTMEADTGNDPREPLSLLALINEESNGLPYSSDGTQWASLQDIDSSQAANSAWAPTTLTYDASDYIDVNQQGDGLQQRLEKLIRFLGFKAPRMMSEYFTRETDPRKHVIFTGVTGTDMFQTCLYQQGERFSAHGRSGDIGFGDFFVNGVPIIEHSELDSVAAFYNGSGLATSAAANNVGPRFICVNTDHLKVKFKKDKFLQQRKPKEPDGTPELWVMPVVSRVIVYRTSARRHGILVPA